MNYRSLVSYKRLGGVVFVLNAMLAALFFYPFSPHSYKINHSVFWLSYIPPLEQDSNTENLTSISLQKINLLDDENLDPLWQMEKFIPVIDKVIYVPKNFHEYSKH